jgi:hypothetical protein
MRPVAAVRTIGRVTRSTGLLVAVALGVAALAVAGVVIVASTGNDDPSSAGEPEGDPPAAPASTAPSSPAPPPGPPVLLPNMRSTGARDISVEVVPEERRLRFAASLANLGPGPLMLVPRGRGRCGPRQHSAVQIVYVDRTGDGRYQRARDRRETRRFSGCMLRHPGHDHWHFDAMAAYSLRLPGARRPLVSRDKVSFCLRDNQRVRGQRVVVPREHFGDCVAGGPQGISPGWVDVYKADLDGQWLRLPPSVDAGVVCLDLEADPEALIEETSETDNSTSVALRVDGATVRRADGSRCR